MKSAYKTKPIEDEFQLREDSKKVSKWINKYKYVPDGTKCFIRFNLNFYKGCLLEKKMKYTKEGNHFLAGCYANLCKRISDFIREAEFREAEFRESELELP